MSIEDKMEVDGRSVFVGNVSNLSFYLYSYLTLLLENLLGGLWSNS